MTYLLDTNVVSEIRKPRPAHGVATWWADAPTGGLYLSALSVGELRRGAVLLHERGDTNQAGLLAATAMVHGFTLVTRNLRDVDRSGVRVVDPFTGVR